jgi:hypothetical protein
MKKLLFTGIVASLLFGESHAANEGKKTFRVQPEKRFLSKTELQAKYAAKEAKASKINQKPNPSSYSNKGSGNGGNSIQTSTVVYSDLGKSINPFTSVTAGRNYVAAVPSLNTVALIRRGGLLDAPTNQTGPGNKLYVDINTKGGADGKWQIGKGGRLFNNEIYDISVNNYGPRYPQGMIWKNPSAPSDTNQAYAFALTRVLDGSNDAWGAMSSSYRSLANGSPLTQNLWSSMVDPVPVFHFRQSGLDQTSNGSIFAVSQEEDLSSGSVVFTDKIMVFKYTYNSATSKFDSSVTFLQFVNSGQDPATSVGDVQIAFGPDGQTGYIAMAAFNPDFNNTFAYTTYLAKTTDGGTTWSDFKLINLNRMPEELNEINPGKKAFRQALLGDYVQFNDTSFTSIDTNAGGGVHPIDYTIMDLDLTVDANNYGHIFGTVCVAGFGDTLQVTGPGYYRPAYGSWNIHLTIPPNSLDSTRATAVNQNVTLQGCWGDCDTEENITEFNRPHIARSEDGNVIVMVWYDTDIIAHPQAREENNSNPDMWYRAIRVTGPGTYAITSQSRNVTKGSNFDGEIKLGSVAPTLLNTATGHAIASTTALLADFDATNGTAIWETSHLYVGGAFVPSAPDSFPAPYNLIGKGSLLVNNKEVVSKVQSSYKSFEVYPNPSEGRITASFSMERGGLANIKVYNNLGRLVENRQQYLGGGELNMALDFKNLNSGIYFLNIQQGKQNLTKRFVIK